MIKTIYYFSQVLVQIECRVLLCGFCIEPNYLTVLNTNINRNSDSLSNDKGFVAGTKLIGSNSKM